MRFLRVRLFIGVCLAGAAAAAISQESRDPCVVTYDQCLRDCDAERWWLFRGEDYRRCTKTCELRLQACEAQDGKEEKEGGSKEGSARQGEERKMKSPVAGALS